MVAPTDTFHIYIVINVEKMLKSYLRIKVKKFVKKVPNVGGYDLRLAFANKGKVTVTATKRGKTKVLASCSTEVMVADYVPGEGWTGDVTIALPKLKLCRTFQGKIADVASVAASAISVE